MGPEVIILISVIAVLLFTTLIVILSRYRKCPSDKILVIYGKVGSNKEGTFRSAKCIHGGAAFIVPVIQSYEYLDLTPMSISVDLKNALSKQNIRIDVPSRFTVGISVEQGVMQNATERLLGMKLLVIQEHENLLFDTSNCWLQKCSWKSFCYETFRNNEACKKYYFRSFKTYNCYNGY